jgi:signal transduction histidine kinase
VGMSSGVEVIARGTGAVSGLAAMQGVPVLSIFEDAEGDHWVGTESSGLHVFRRLLFHAVAALGDVPMTAVAQTADGAMWVGTRDYGLFRVRNGEVDRPVENRLLTSAVILCLEPGRDGGLWVGTPDGLNHVDGRGGVRRMTTSDGLPDDYIRSLAAGTDGSVWVGTRHGLDHLVGGRHEVLTSMDGLGGDLIGAMLVEPRDQAVWVATSGGLSRVSRDGAVRNFVGSEGLRSPIVTAMARDGGGRLWVATVDGMVSVFDGARFRALFQVDGRGGPEQTVESLTFDRGGALWVHLERGIERVRAAQVGECLRASPCVLRSEWVTRYGRTDGLRNDEAVPATLAEAWLTAQGELWFPTRAGVAVAETADLREAREGPPVVIEQMLVDDAPVDLRQGMPAMAYGRRRVSIDYAGLDFRSPAGVMYRCRLDGFDKDWQREGNRRTVTYTNLAPGTYTFHVEARASDGDWSRTDAELQFRILPPFYRRWWFVAVVVLGVIALLAGVYLLRLRVLRQRFDAVLAERNRMAREIHDTLTQDLVSTCLQLDIVAQQLKTGQAEKAVEQVKRARRLVTEGLAEARQSIWELRSNDARETLPKQMAHLMQRETFAGLKPQLEVQGAYRVLSPQLEREILRLTNEALVNVTRHAEAEWAKVTLYYSTEALMLTVEDNGAGFDVDAAGAKGHFGLMGMKERASVVDGALEIVSRRGEGTTVRLRVPLKPTSEGRGKG